MRPFASPFGSLGLPTFLGFFCCAKFELRTIAALTASSGDEYVCHVHYCITISVPCQALLCYIYSMPLLILAVLLTVTQGAPPLPRKTADNQASQTAKHQHKTNADQNNATPSVASPASPPAPQSDGGANPAAPSNAEKPVTVAKLPAVTVSTDWWSKAGVILTGIYVLLTSALVGVGIFGVRYARRSLRAIESQLTKMGEQVAEMQSAGKQTGAMIEQMKETAQTELRAYVCLAEAVIEFRQERAPEVRVSMQNFGKTPAHDLRWTSGSIIAAYPWPARFPELADFPTAVSVFAPGGKPYTMIFKQPTLSGQLAQVLGTPHATLWVFGNVTYRDAFGKSHYTNYRLMFGGAEKVPVRQHPNGYKVALMKTDREGNDAD